MNRSDRIIRKIIVGNDIKNGMVFQVGSVIKHPSKSIEITQINIDGYTASQLDKIRYDIYVRDGDEQAQKLWKSFMDVSITVEYDLND